MRSSPFLIESEAGKSRYTDLFACICEEEDGYSVQVRLYNKGKSKNAAKGEEMADSFETASMLVAALAAEFSIDEARITIEIRMHDVRSSTRH